MIPNPSMKSYIMLSPGWIGAVKSFSMVVDEFDIVRASFFPYEADAPRVLIRMQR